MRRVDPADFTKVSALVNVVLGLDKPEQDLGHAYRVFELAVWECERCLQVPIGALFRSGDRWNVFVVEGERLRRVELKRMNDEVAQVLGGLNAGADVVIHPGDTLEEGSLVTRRD